MPEILTKKKAIDKIVREARKLDKMQLQILLTRLRIKKLLKEKAAPVIKYDSSKIKAPTLNQIDKWKHQSRTLHAKG
ncbi:MAG TPA: hypothetical protein VIH86_05690 [Puia sp.]